MSAVAECKEAPEVVGGGKVDPVKASYAHGDKVEVECSSGYKSEGATKAVCEEGEFSEEKFTCKKRE